jgi:hypothetical protein
MLPFTIPEKLLKYGPLIIAGLIVAVLLTLSYCSGHKAGKQGEIVGQQEREIETQRDLGKANEKAADRMLEDAAGLAAQEKELKDALEATTDPDLRRTLRGCIILRQQGRDTSHIPACR